ncbi:CoA transferase [Pseudomonas sp. GD03721]|nr:MULTISPECIES: CaiB/BaiF CoA-transferase family protein [unclassified Pseudomonas]MDH1440448.1 CoA transferase [Pseudomonas sp. GD03722]WGG03464.1 CoA transferase [Pseudomonas sp. GD03721]WGG07632.1 CoA transferase [Pseudomonas sp. GD03919]
MSAPLSSLKVLDFSTLLPGPFATLLLADMGAEVLRVESASRVDLVRSLPPVVNGVSASHAYLNRNKRCIALDLKKSESQALVRQLIASYDVIVEQFRPGVMDAFNLGYEALRQINPRLIYVSVTGYGQSGPYRQRAGHDLNYLALSGLSSYSGRKEYGPAPLGMQVADVAGGSLHAVAALLAAVIQRQHTGEGQHVDVSMADCVLTLNGVIAAGFLADRKVPDYESHMLNGGGFYDYYQTRDDRWLAVASMEPKFQQALCDALERPELMALAGSARAADQQAFKAALKAVFVAQDLHDWCELFAGADACVEPVLNLAEALEHPHFQARDMIRQVPGEDGQVHRQLACPVRFSRSETRLRHAGKPVGADSLRVLQELGYDQEQVAALYEAGAVS